MKEVKKSKLLNAAVMGIMAASAASLIFSSPVKAADTKSAEPTGKCMGVNGCKGQGACGGTGHDCAGKNACKGKGWLKMSKKDCDAKKGTWEAMPTKK